jgi:hypothetical protein
MTHRNLVIACFLLLSIEQANSATWNIDGVFATQTFDSVDCPSGPYDSSCFYHSVFNINNPLTGSFDISNGVVTNFDLNFGGLHFTKGSASGIENGEFFYYSISPTYTVLQFAFADGVLSDGLLHLWTDYDPWFNWDYKFTNLTGTAVDPPTVTPLPPALPLFAFGLGVLLWRGTRAKDEDAR